MVLFYTLFPSIVSRVALTFSCRVYGNPQQDTERLLLTEALSIKCLTGEHWSIMLSLGFPIVFIYIFFIPGSIAYTLVRQRKARTLFVHQTQYNPQHTIRFGFMFAGYREGYEFWECVVMLRKCAFVLLSVFLRQYGASPQVVAASIVLFFATSVHLQYRPYNDPKHNEIESVGLHACQLQLLVALISNMIGRVNPLVVQSPIGPISTAVVILFVFASTIHFFWISILWTVRRSQTTKGIMGVASRCCGKQCPRLCRAVEVEENSHVRNKRRVQSMPRVMSTKVGRMGTIRGSLRYNVKVAMHLRQGNKNMKMHRATRDALQAKLQMKQIQSRSRLKARIQSRTGIVLPAAAKT